MDIDDTEGDINRNSSLDRSCLCPSCFLPILLHVYNSLFRRAEVQTNPGASLNPTTPVDDSLADTYRAPPRPLPYVADPQQYRIQRDGLFSSRGKGSSNSQEEFEQLRSEGESDPTTDKCNESTCENGSKVNRKFPVSKSTKVMGYSYLSSEDDECPTCLEEYTEDNPRIVTKCSHHFHLGCIYEWMERSEKCPVCDKVMAFDESA